MPCHGFGYRFRSRSRSRSRGRRSRSTTKKRYISRSPVRTRRYTSIPLSTEYKLYWMADSKRKRSNLRRPKRRRSIRTLIRPRSSPRRLRRSPRSRSRSYARFRRSSSRSRSRSRSPYSYRRSRRSTPRRRLTFLR